MSSTRAWSPDTWLTSASSSSACSRPGTATPPRRRTTSASPGSREWTTTIRSCPTSIACPRAGSRASSSSGRIPPEARRNARPASRGTAQPRLAGGARLVRDRERRVLERRPGCSPTRRHQDRSVLHPGRRRAGEGGQPHQYPAMLQWHDKALDPLGDSRSDAWFLYNFGKRLKQLYAGSTDPQGPTPAPPHLGLRLRPAAATARRQPQPDRGRAGPGEGAHGDQWVPAG